MLSIIVPPDDNIIEIIENSTAANKLLDDINVNNFLHYITNKDLTGDVTIDLTINDNIYIFYNRLKMYISYNWDWSSFIAESSSSNIQLQHIINNEFRTMKNDIDNIFINGEMKTNIQEKLQEIKDAKIDSTKIWELDIQKFNNDNQAKLRKIFLGDKGENINRNEFEKMLNKKVPVATPPSAPEVKWKFHTNKISIIDALNNDQLIPKVRDRYFKFDIKKIEKIKEKLDTNELFYLATDDEWKNKRKNVKKSSSCENKGLPLPNKNQKTWHKIDQESLEEELKKYYTQWSCFEADPRRKVQKTLAQFKKMETEPQYINIYEKKDSDDESKAIEKAVNKFAYHYEAVDTFKKTAATYNNDKSSRSHLVYEILVSVTNNEKLVKHHNMIICDLAGKEDVIDAEKMKTYIKDTYDKAALEEQKANEGGNKITIKNIFDPTKRGKVDIDAEKFPFLEQLQYLNELNIKYQNSSKEGEDADSKEAKEELWWIF